MQQNHGLKFSVISVFHLYQQIFHYL